MELYEDMKNQIQTITHSQYAIQVLDSIFTRPIFKTTDFVNESKIHKPTAMNLLRQLKQEGLLNELRPASGRRAAVLCFSKLINIAEGKKVF